MLTNASFGDELQSNACMLYIFQALHYPHSSVLPFLVPSTSRYQLFQMDF